MKPMVKILHLTDLHLFGDHTVKLLGINPLHSLQRIVAKILRELPLKHPDLIVLTGDVSQDFSLASYKTAREILQQLACPIVSTMGNHDYLPFFTKILGKPTQLVTKIRSLTNWQIILLNSHYPHQIEGLITDQDLAFLQKSLIKKPTNPTIIFLHHQILPVGSNWLDKIKLKNSSQILEIIANHKNIKAVVCGHVHQETSILHQNTIFISTPSTSWQFVLNSQDFKLDTIMPGYRWINLHQDGTMQTEVLRLEHDKEFIPDTNSQGY